MKILIVMGGFFPGQKYGGPPVSVDNFCSLMKEHDCYIVTRNHDFGEEIEYSDINIGWNDRGNCKVLYLSDKRYKKKIFERVIKEIAPNILYLQGLFQSCILPCLRLADKYNLPVLLAPRGELCTGAINIRKWKKVLYIEFLKLMGLVKKIHWHSTSDEETKAIKLWMEVENDNIHRLNNIPSLPKQNCLRNVKKTGEGRFVILSRIHPKKNIKFAISLFRDINGKAQYDIYGPIEDEEYWDECQIEIDELPANVQVNYKGMVCHEQVHEILSQYDALLFPTLSENYGHVIAESLLAGTPVIISDQTPWHDLEKDKVGWDISLGNVPKFEKTIQSVIAYTDEEISLLAKNAQIYVERKMRLDIIEKDYLKVLYKLSE